MKVILFYKFIQIEDPNALKNEQRKLCESLGLKGRMLIAHEGVNATFEGTAESILKYTQAMRVHPLFSDVVFKESVGAGKSFTRLRILVRKEIVTLEAGEFDIKNETAKALTAEELQQMYEKNEDFIVLDLRNEYELAVGKFENTVDPKLRNFRDLPKKLSELEYLKKKKVVAVCTGGIRCEKATCLLKREGFENIYQLKDGIHTYIQKYPSSKFRGSLFVFDNRMTTPVVDIKDREVVGQCVFCDTKCEKYYSDDSVRPSKKLICCDGCITTHPELRNCVTDSDLND